MRYCLGTAAKATGAVSPPYLGYQKWTAFLSSRRDATGYRTSVRRQNCSGFFQPSRPNLCQQTATAKATQGRNSFHQGVGTAFEAALNGMKESRTTATTGDWQATAFQGGQAATTTTARRDIAAR